MKMTDCPECGGSGYVEFDTVDAQGEYEGEEDVCEYCEGAGEVDDEEEGEEE